jgi:hypothetical protein
LKPGAFKPSGNCIQFVQPHCSEAADDLRKLWERHHGWGDAFEAAVRGGILLAAVRPAGEGVTRGLVELFVRDLQKRTPCGVINVDGHVEAVTVSLAQALLPLLQRLQRGGGAVGEERSAVREDAGADASGTDTSGGGGRGSCGEDKSVLAVLAEAPHAVAAHKSQLRKQRLV